MSCLIRLYFFFFFQAEDGIRDWSVTGVQTCALPISGSPTPALVTSLRGRGPQPQKDEYVTDLSLTWQTEIGRASCRERVEISVGAGAVKKKRTEREWGGGGGCRVAEAGDKTSER